MKITKKHTIFLSSIILGFLILLSSVPAFAAGVNTWTTKASMDNARGYHQVAAVGGKIYSIGGQNGSYPNAIEEYAPSTDTWTTKATMSTARAYHQVAVVDGKIYIIGGQNGNGYISTLEVYDPITNSLTVKAAMSTARIYHQVEVLDGKIYAIGGYNSTNGYLNSIEEYNPATNTWTNKAAMANPRREFQTAVVGGKIYAIGGINNNGYLSSVEEYNPATNTWTTKSPMPTARSTYKIAVMNRKIYAIGGYGAGYINSVEEYDPSTDKWVSKAAMPTARREHEVITVGEKIYALGGNGGSSNTVLNSVEEYNPATNTWVRRNGMPTVRYSHQLAQINGKIYVIGGNNGSTYLNSVEEFATEYSVLPAPINLTAKATNSKVNLSWPAVDGATSYRIKRATSADGPYTTIASVSMLSYIDTSVSVGVKYFYVISAVNADGESVNSDEVSVTTSVNDAATIEVSSIDKTRLGTEITANIIIHNATNICAEDLKIAYDTSKLQFISSENADGLKIYKEDDIAAGIKRYITACLGKANAANGDKILLKMKFKAIAAGEAKIDVVYGRIADNATVEMDVSQENCGEKTVLIVGGKDVNRTGEYTLLDLGIDAWYYGDAVENTDTSKYDADQVINGTIDDDDLTEIVTQILGNTNYSANK